MSNPDANATEVYQGRDQRVLRVRDPAAGPLLVKQGRADGDLDAARSALHNEQQILERLRGLAGCPHLVRYDPAKPELAVTDFDGVALGASGFLGTVDLERFLALAENLAQALAGVHGRGVILNDLNPAGCLVCPDDLRVQFSEVQSATTFAEERPGFDRLSCLPAPLAYLSPEQTGRMNRPVDYRTDLYRHWGAAGKARAMRSALPFIDPGAPGGPDGRGAGLGDALDHEALRGAEPLARMTRAAAEAQRGIAATVLRLGLKTLAPVVSDDAVSDSRFAADPHFAGLALCSLLALPVSVHGRATAFLILENRLLRAAFTAGRIEALSMLCGQLAISLENARLYQSLEHKVAQRTGELSEANRLLSEAIRRSEAEIAERRRAEEALPAEWRRASRSRRPLGLAMLDVDWFKNYNDRYGHQAGDECLRTLAGVLGAQAHRISDLAARYGGEEFAVIAPDTDAAGMLRLAESIHAALEALALPHAASSFGRVTVSIGVAALGPTPETRPETLLRLADEALYRAKAQGRNRTVLGAPGTGAGAARA